MAVKSTMTVLCPWWLWCLSHSSLLQARRAKASGGEGDKHQAFSHTFKFGSASHCHMLPG